ncbi:MAG TPA: hypothetical protein VEX35_03025 [Allosphingosinicella sp.]|nr:hypothetical protein [Allosphingosinicella sp.]
MVRILLMLLALMAAPTPALADITATYHNQEVGGSFTIWVADNGDARLQFSHQEWWMQIVGGEAYAVHPRAGTPRVSSFANLERLVTELRPGVPPAPAQEHSGLMRQGELTIAGYRGIAYYRNLPPPPAGFTPPPALVVSRDPALAALGPVLLRRIEFAAATNRLMGLTIPPTFAGIRALIGDGAALSFIGFDLVSIDRSPIDPALLRLPAPPVTLEELRAGGMPNIS